MEGGPLSSKALGPEQAVAGVEMARRPSKPKLLDQVRERMRLLRYSPATAKAYISWIRKYILYHGKRHPSELGEREIGVFLTHLAKQLHLSASSQNQALSALLFLYRKVLSIPLDDRIDLIRARRPKHIPVVLSKEEVQMVLDGMKGVPRLAAQLLYGTGMRIKECIKLRVSHIDFSNQWIMIVDGKGAKDRVTLLPKSLRKPLENHLQDVERLHNRDLKRGFGAAYLPDALHVKYPSASHDFRWQFVFPSARISSDAKSGFRGRWHMSSATISKQMALAASKAGIAKRVTPHVLRHCFATHLLDGGADIRLVQSLLGHKHVTTTMVYAHLVDSRRALLESPVDDIFS
jgi:integron integrase